jgi:pyruvate,water dikinase
MQNWLVTLGPEPCAVELAGGKAAGLARLVAAGLPVPPAFAVTTTAFSQALGDLVDRLEQFVADVDVHDAHALALRCAQARDLIRVAVAGHPSLALATEAARGVGRVAVRSSGVDEDGARQSHAGEHDSYLDVPADDVAARVVDCWASLYTDRAVSYRRHHARPTRPMGVVVQQMVDARAAGVMMTLNPATGDRSVIAVESVHGLGEALVAGEVTPDRFLVNRVTGELIRRDLASPDASLSAHHLAQLVAWAPLLELCAAGAADIEFALDRDDRLWLLQVRPETYWSNQPRRRPHARGSALDAILTTLAPGATDHV